LRGGVRTYEVRPGLTVLMAQDFGAQPDALVAWMRSGAVSEILTIYAERWRK
jgi:hypothetical protein